MEKLFLALAVAITLATFTPTEQKEVETPKEEQQWPVPDRIVL